MKTYEHELAHSFGEGAERLTDLKLETWRLPLCVIRTVLLELLDHAIEIGMTGTKAPCEPVPAALRILSPSAILYEG